MIEEKVDKTIQDQSYNSDLESAVQTQAYTYKNPTVFLFADYIKPAKRIEKVEILSDGK